MTDRTRTYSWTAPEDTAHQLAGRSGLEFVDGMRTGEIPPPPFSATLDFGRFTTVEPGRVVAELDVAEFHYNPLGSVHGGVIATILDTCTGCAVQTTLPTGVGYTSADLVVKFIRPVAVKHSPLTATGVVEHSGRSTAVARAEITTADGQVAAIALSTCFILRP